MSPKDKHSKKHAKELEKAAKKALKAEKELKKALKAKEGKGKKKGSEVKAAEKLERAHELLAESTEAVRRVGTSTALPKPDALGDGEASSYPATARGVRTTGGSVSLAEIDPGSSPEFSGEKSDGEAQLAEGSEVLSALQEKLFAQSRVDPETPAVLLVLQGMDTAGKGGIVRHVVGAVDPQGIEHMAFKAPTDEEKKHDFLWRIRKHVPTSGYLGVFDRSHYEDVLIHRVHGWADEAEIQRRYDAIVEFEDSLAASGVKIVKVMLHISPQEQANRLQERLDRPDKYWKYNPGDIDERSYWADYQDAYERAIEATSTEASPWNIVPADAKWYARLAVQNLLIEALQDINPSWPAAHFNVGAERARLTASRSAIQ
jgi:PPK2 family polyphosphate:nucleotide phosphotransferase